MSAMSVCKKLILAVAIALFLSLPAPAAVWAAAIPAGFDEWPMKTTEDTKKTWSVKFNLPVDADSVRGSSIYVTDNNNQLVNTTPIPTTATTVEVVPAAPYTPGKEYRLFVKGGAAGGVTSGNGSILLKKPIVVPFVVADSDARILLVSSAYTALTTKITVYTRPDVYTVKVKINATLVEMKYIGNNKYVFEDLMNIYGLEPGDEVDVKAYNSGGGLLETVKHTIT